MLLPEDVDVAAASPEELRRLVAELLGEVARLRDENAALREEIAVKWCDVRTEGGSVDQEGQQRQRCPR